MLMGAIAGDMAGSIFERSPLQQEKDAFHLFSPGSRFTDDSVLTLAVARGLMDGERDPSKTKDSVRAALVDFGLRYPKAGYGRSFSRWLASRGTLHSCSFGNGSAMRVSPVAWAFDTLEDVKRFAAISAETTHGHPEGVKGAVATAAAIFLARTGKSKEEIRETVAARTGYDLSTPLAEIRPTYSFDVTCQGSVPQAIRCFLESENFEDALRLAIWLRGDSDTQAAIAGSMAEAFYKGVPQAIEAEVRSRLDSFLLETLDAFNTWAARG